MQLDQTLQALAADPAVSADIYYAAQGIAWAIRSGRVSGLVAHAVDQLTPAEGNTLVADVAADVAATGAGWTYVPRFLVARFLPEPVTGVVVGSGVIQAGMLLGDIAH